MSKEETTKERLADLIHAQWAHWTQYMLDNLTDENIERWRGQIDTPYEDLSEKEKNSDRGFVGPYLAIIEEETPTIIHASKELINVLGEVREAERTRIKGIVEEMRPETLNDPDRRTWGYAAALADLLNKIDA